VTGRAPRVPAVHRAAAVLDAVARAGSPLALAQLARETGLPKSTALAVSQALVGEGLLLRGQDSTYRLGPRLAQLAGAATQQRPLVSRVGVSVPAADNLFFAAELRAVEEEAGLLSASVLHRAGDTSVGTQREHLRELLDRGIDLLLVDPVTTGGLEDALSLAGVRGVPVVSMNGASAGADAAVTTDNTQAGALAGRFLAERLGGRGSVVVLDGTRVTAVTDRVAGFLDTLRQHAGMRVVARLAGDNSTPTAAALVAALLSGGTRPDAIFAINDPSALGAAAACTAVGAMPLIVGVDGSDAAVRQIRRGGPIVATVAQDPYRLGRTAFRLGVDLRAGALPTERTVLLPTRIIAERQVEDHRAWG
jgi:ribose transport system substrate-binding protein